MKYEASVNLLLGQVEIEYDWDRLDFLLAKYAALREALKRDIRRFCDLLSALPGDQ